MTTVLSERAGVNPGLATLALADGVVLAVLDTGPADAAVTVVLVHGWSQDHTSWEDVTAALRREHPELRIVAPDARGATAGQIPGRETPPPSTTWPTISPR